MRPLRGLLFLLAMQSGFALADDMKGSADHPMVGRYEGSEIVGYETNAYDEAAIVEGPFDPASDRTGPGFRTIEGRSTLIYYAIPEGRSSLEVLRNYESSLKSKGFSVDFACSNSDGSCFTTGEPEAAYLIGNAVGNPLSLPKLVDDYVHNWFGERSRYLLAQTAGPNGTVYAAIYLGESARGTVAVVRVVETTKMETDKIVFLNAGQMQQAIADTGKAVLYGIQFEFDKDALRPDSAPTLAEIAELLKQHPDLRLTIVGHTDNKGGASYNMDLSSRRADRVVTALVKDYGIAADRLSSTGAGSTAPIASNATDDGRAKNRRVELVTQ